MVVYKSDACPFVKCTEKCPFQNEAGCTVNLGSNQIMTNAEVNEMEPFFIRPWTMESAISTRR